MRSKQTTVEGGQHGEWTQRRGRRSKRRLQFLLHSVLEFAQRSLEARWDFAVTHVFECHIVRGETILRQVDATVVRVLAQVAQHLALADADADAIRGRADCFVQRRRRDELRGHQLLDRAAAARAVGAQLAHVRVRHAREIHVGCGQQFVQLGERVRGRRERVVQQARRRMLRAAVDEPIDLGAPPLQARMRDVVIGALRGLADLRIDDVQRAQLRRVCLRARTAARSSASSPAARRG